MSKPEGRRGFRVVALEAERLASLFDCSDEELREQGIRRMTVEEDSGTPCRVSLEEARMGETVLLLPWVHHDVDTPYRASGPVFVRRGVPTARPRAGEIPAMLRTRLLSLRGYDREGMLVESDVLEGRALEQAITRLFADPSIEYLHIHNARPGCFNCAVVRA